jgi:hypothetical protein
MSTINNFYLNSEMKGYIDLYLPKKLMSHYWLNFAKQQALTILKKVPSEKNNIILYIKTLQQEIMRIEINKIN